MYSDRNFELVVVSMNKPGEKPVVTQWLEKAHATSRNLLFDSENTAELQKAFDPKWEAGPEVPYTILLDADGMFSTKQTSRLTSSSFGERFLPTCRRLISG